MLLKVHSNMFYEILNELNLENSMGYVKCYKQHPEKCFVETTKIWLAQQCFSFKYGPMEILLELTKKYC